MAIMKQNMGTLRLVCWLWCAGVGPACRPNPSSGASLAATRGWVLAARPGVNLVDINKSVNYGVMLGAIYLKIEDMLEGDRREVGCEFEAFCSNADAYIETSKLFTGWAKRVPSGGFS